MSNATKGTTRGKLHAAIEARGWSIRQTAERAGVPDSTARGYLSGAKAHTTFEVVRALAQALGVSLDWIGSHHLDDAPVPPWAWVVRPPVLCFSNFPEANHRAWEAGAVAAIWSDVVPRAGAVMPQVGSPQPSPPLPHPTGPELSILDSGD
jgi:transcriptional regulator with XRE-family HTH domain